MIGKQPTGEVITRLLIQAGFTHRQFEVTDRSDTGDSGYVTVYGYDEHGNNITTHEADGRQLLAKFTDAIDAAGYWAWMDYPGVSVIAWDTDRHGPFPEGDHR